MTILGSGRQEFAAEGTYRSVPLPDHALTRAEAPADARAAGALAAQLGAERPVHVFVFASPSAAFEQLCRDLSRALPGVAVSACTTAGEIGKAGYSEDGIVAVGLPKQHFASETVVIRGLRTLDASKASTSVTLARARLAQARPDLRNIFAFLICDGLSLREDMLMAAITPPLGGLPIFGGSAGDGARFEQTHLYHEGELLDDAAVLTLIATSFRVQVFSLDHLRPTDRRMVVTSADPERRLVREINAEPAAREYARIVGLNPDQLDEFAFAAHPVAVRLGDQHHVRAIQRVTPDGHLAFFSAVDEGMVLTVAEAQDIVEHLDKGLAALAKDEPPLSILACDCILRRVAAEREQKRGRLGAILARYGVTGFSTYGEQVGPIHLNQTLTGVAFYPPPEDEPPA